MVRASSSSAYFSNGRINKRLSHATCLFSDAGERLTRPSTPRPFLSLLVGMLHSARAILSHSNHNFYDSSIQLHLASHLGKFMVKLLYYQ